MRSAGLRATLKSPRSKCKVWSFSHADSSRPGTLLFLQRRSLSSSSRRGAKLRSLGFDRKALQLGPNSAAQEPQQLMDSFTDLEELNLFLIQSSQARCNGACLS